MDFEEITLVVPWLELALDLGIDPDAPQVAEPRAFKSHLSWHEVPKGGRYITMVRDPGDVLVSMYYFHEGWRFEAGAITLEDYARNFFLAPERDRGYWKHVASWWPQRGREDVLMLSYESALADVPGTVRRIAGFIGCPLDGELLEIVVRQSSIGFMKAHGTRFDDHVLRAARNAANGLPPGGASSKLRSGPGGRPRGQVADGREGGPGRHLARGDGEPFRARFLLGDGGRPRPRRRLANHWLG